MVEKMSHWWVQLSPDPGSSSCCSRDRLARVSLRFSVLKGVPTSDPSYICALIEWTVSQLEGMRRCFPLVWPYHLLTKFWNYRYDPKTDMWTTVSSLSVPRDAVGVCLLGDRLYAVGGYDGQTYLNTVESYDAQNNEWTEVIRSTKLYLSQLHNIL